MALWGLGALQCLEAILGGSWVVISGAISRVTIHIRGLITLLITTHEPPSRGRGGVEQSWGFSRSFSSV